MHYRLVPATNEDRPWLDELRRAVYQELFVATWGDRDETRHLRHCDACWERGNIYRIEIDTERVGMIQLFDHADTLEIGEIQIQPARQGHGIGTRVLQDTIARAHAKSTKVTLRTGLQNLRALKLYERLGLQHVSQSETHFHMESELDASSDKDTLVF